MTKTDVFHMFAKCGEDITDDEALVGAAEAWPEACALAGATPVETPTFEIVYDHRGIPGRGVIGKALATRETP